MFSKMFLSILLLTCVYTYMLKSIKDNKDTNLEKLPDDLNFELNQIQTVKPNLKFEFIKKIILNSHIGTIFGNNFTYALSRLSKKYGNFSF